MGFFDFLKKLKQSINSNDKESNTSQEKDQEFSSNDSLILDLLNSRDFDENSLKITEIYDVADTLKSYISTIIPEISRINDHNVVKNKPSFAKLKKIISHTSELDNYTQQLLIHYHEPVLEILQKINSYKSNQEISRIILALENHKQRLTALHEKLIFFITFSEILNVAEVSPAIEQELITKTQSGEIVQLLAQLKENINESLVGSVNIKYVIDAKIFDRVRSIIYGQKPENTQ